ncbi:MAG: hypothetical protein HOP30_06015 [Cyclobacteriaceae bacterium]|nr:hypothetical protein [Cyclobacteriaceae bacterium]
MFAMPMVLPAQDNGGTGIPLDHFYAERESSGAFRKILTKITFGVNLGYGNSYLSHDLSGLGLYQVPNLNPQIFVVDSLTRYSNWVNDPSIDKTLPSNTAFYSNPGKANIGFKGNALNIPLNLFLYYGFNRYRVGAGYSYEIMSIGTLNPTGLTDKIKSLQLPNSSGFVSKYYLLLGASFYRTGDYLFTGDIHLGSFTPTGNFSSTVTGGMYFDLGLTAEREFSEYFKVFVRPSFELKSYSVPLPGSSKVIENSMNALYFNFGVTYRIPELPRCYLKDCHVQINHAHGSKEYRSRRHPFYKKQNPGYGENDKTLIKYRGKNKRKLNPY